MANRNIPTVGRAMITEALQFENAEIFRGNLFEVTYEFEGVAGAARSTIY